MTTMPSASWEQAGDAFSELARIQDQVLRRDQFRGTRISRAFVAAQLDAQRWRRAGPLAVVLHNGPLTRAQELWVAVFNAEPPVALCGRTAAAEAGLIGWPPTGIDIVIQRGAKVASVPGLQVNVHESRRFTETDIHATTAPPRTTIARSAVDAAVWTFSARGACGIVASTVQQGLCTARHLLQELEKAGRVRHRRLLESALVDIEGGSHALSELDFLRFCRRNGLPKPERQVVRRDSNGRRRYLDAVLRANGRTVLVEIDGAAHVLVATYWDDMYRDNDITIAGEVQLRYPSVAMRLDGDRMADQIRRALGLPRTCQNVSVL